MEQFRATEGTFKTIKRKLCERKRKGLFIFEIEEPIAGIRVKSVSDTDQVVPLEQLLWFYTLCSDYMYYFGFTVELQWLEHFSDHENMFETGVVRANEC